MRRARVRMSRRAAVCVAVIGGLTSTPALAAVLPEVALQLEASPCGVPPAAPAGGWEAPALDLVTPGQGLVRVRAVDEDPDGSERLVGDVAARVGGTDEVLELVVPVGPCPTPTPTATPMPTPTSAPTPTSGPTPAPSPSSAAEPGVAPPTSPTPTPGPAADAAPGGGGDGPRATPAAATLPATGLTRTDAPFVALVLLGSGILVLTAARRRTTRGRQGEP